MKRLLILSSEDMSSVLRCAVEYMQILTPYVELIRTEKMELQRGQQPDGGPVLILICKTCRQEILKLGPPSENVSFPNRESSGESLILARKSHGSECILRN